MFQRFLSPGPVAALTVIAALLVPAFASPYVIKVLIMAGIYIGLASSLNMIFGIAGQMNLGHASFYGIGSYTAALLSVHYQLPFLLALLAGALMSAGIGFAIAYPIVRLKGIYLSVTTLALGEIIRLVLLNWVSVTRGPMGVSAIPVPSIFGMQFMSNTSQYYLMLGLLIPVLVIIWRLSQSSFGMSLRAIRGNEEAAGTLGINAHAYKVKAFVIGSGTAGLFGAFFSFHAAYINPGNFTFAESITVLSMVVFGGMGSVPGVVIGALLLAVMPDVLRFMEHYRMIIYGLLLFFMVLLRPQGIFSEAASMKWASWKWARDSGGKSVPLLQSVPGKEGE